MNNASDHLYQQAIAQWQGLNDSKFPLITIGTATCGRCAGALDVVKVFRRNLKKAGIRCHIIEVGCLGPCYAEPIVCIKKPSQPTICYGNVTPQRARQLIDDYLLKDDPLARYALGSIGEGTLDGIRSMGESAFFRPQVRRALRNCGFIDPLNINHYVARCGYSGLVKALGLGRDNVLAEIEHSGLRGRGGAGFPTWKKWQFCKDVSVEHKYLICNADEGDPGAFMNRSLIEGDPHSLLEGMLIAGYTVGASEGYIYCRAEYPLALERLHIAIKQAQANELLGENILGSDFCFHIKVREGAGAFVCGEETALIASIEGQRGMPRPRPPFPAVSGLWSAPTIINNVETLASVAMILQNGADWFSEYGCAQSKGTKTFALVGKVKNTGLVEVPLGISLRTMIDDIGGGCPGNRKIKAVQTGGPSGGCIPHTMFDLSLDYDSLTTAGAIMGSGGMVVMDENTCMVDVARYFLEFTQKESCGKCVPCRLGTKQMLQILEGITKGRGRPEDIDLLIEIGEAVKKSALCGLGQTAPNPVLTTIRYFREEYEAHIKYKKCPAAVCKEIISSPCQHTCPIDTQAPVYISYIAKGRFKKAFESIIKDNPLPSVCSRVCHHPCESKCQAGRWECPIAIRALKRSATDWAISLKIYPSNKRGRPTKGRGKVAIIGSGPAGLTAGYFLVHRKYDVTIFEALDVIGGGLAVYIPEYRLPKKILNIDLQNIKNSGVKFKLNTRVGKDILLNRLRKDYDAVLIATGAHRSRRLNIPDEDCQGIWDAMELLKKINCGQAVDVGKKVGVIGGGNAAVDAARSCARVKGCEKVVLIYRRTRNEMPAFKEEVDALIQEGIEVQFLQAPKRIISTKGRLKGLECVRMELKEADASGRRKPYPIAGSESVIDLDTLVVAVGEGVETNFIDKGTDIRISEQGTIIIDAETFSTDVDGVFAVGDVVTGPNTVIEAMSQAKVAAEMIDRYIRKQKLRREYKFTRPSIYLPAVELTEEEIEHARRPDIPSLDVNRRKHNFQEVDLNISKNAAVREARRCLRCDLETEEAKNRQKT